MHAASPTAVTGATDLTQTIRVFIVEDHPIVRHGLRQLINQQPDMQVSGEAENVAEAMEQLGSVAMDVAVIDLILPDGDGMNLIREIRTRQLPAKLLVMSTRDPAVYGPIARTAGADGYVSKHQATQRIIKAIRSVFRGQSYFRGQDSSGGVTHWFG